MGVLQEHLFSKISLLQTSQAGCGGDESFLPRGAPQTSREKVGPPANSFNIYLGVRLIEQINDRVHMKYALLRFALLI